MVTQIKSLLYRLSDNNIVLPDRAQRSILACKDSYVKMEEIRQQLYALRLQIQDFRAHTLQLDHITQTCGKQGVTL